jgi:hypothetical protein
MRQRAVMAPQVHTPAIYSGRAAPIVVVHHAGPTYNTAHGAASCEIAVIFQITFPGKKGGPPACRCPPCSRSHDANWAHFRVDRRTHGYYFPFFTFLFIPCLPLFPVQSSRRV